MPERRVARVKLKMRIALKRNSASELRDVSCHMGWDVRPTCQLPPDIKSDITEHAPA